MFQLFETIKCSEGELFNLDYHQKRFDMSRKKLFGCTYSPLLADSIRILPEFMKGLFRCRITYSCSIEKIEFIPHEYRKIDSLKLAYTDQVDYGFKYTDRSMLEQLFSMREKCDDILIVQRDCITDSFTANILLFDGENWWTPDTPLLPGTQRARLLDNGIIRECRVTVADLFRFEKVGLINAMQDMENMPVIPVSRIIQHSHK